jgi:hypothetical protein
MTEAQKVTLEFTIDELNVVLAGLGELPAKASLALIDRIRAEATQQLQAQQAAPAEAVQ